MGETGTLWQRIRTFTDNRGSAKKKRLFSLMATNNRIYADVIAKLRLLDRKRPGIDPAEWKHEHYYEMWEGLWQEFEIQSRFQNLDFKLEMIQNNTKFFLEVIDGRTGEKLEWYIIVLISAEIVISLYEIVFLHS